MQSEIKDTLIEIENNLQGNNSRVDEAENQISDLEHKEATSNHSEQQEQKKNKTNEDSRNSLWDNFKRSNIHLIGVPEGKEKEKKIGILSENIVKENFPNNMEVQEVHRILIMTDAKRPTPKHIIIKRPKFKG